MPYEPNYFGVKMGEAIAGGLGHISKGLERKYEMQRRDEQRANEQALRAPMDELKKQKMIAEIEALNSNDGNKPPTGYRTIPGGLEPIPGGPVAQKIEEDKKNKEMSREDFLDTIERGKKAISETIKNVNWRSAGILGVQADKPSAWNMDANQLAGQIQHIESIVGLQVIEKMKKQSKTGATGFGQLSNQELGLLTSNISNIKANLNKPEVLRKNLHEIYDVLEIWKNRSERQNIKLPGLDDKEAEEFRRLEGKFGGK